jgi:hypothetical protein
VLDFMILWALAVGAAQAETEIPDSAGYFVLGVFVLSGPVGADPGRPRPTLGDRSGAFDRAWRPTKREAGRNGLRLAIVR